VPRLQCIIPQPQKNSFKRNNPKIIFCLSLLAFIAAPVAARDLQPGAEQAPVCAIISSFVGQISIMDANRTKTVEPERKMVVGCGSWISVVSGSLHLKHRDGHNLTVGAGSFASLGTEKDQVLLYRGSVYAEVSPGAPELRMISANARAKIRQGTVVLVYNDELEDSQLITLDKTAALENRFIEDKRMIVKAGEASSLNFKLLRVIPSAPRAVSQASLKSVLVTLNLDLREQKHLARSAEARQGRRPASFAILSHDPERSADSATSETAIARRKHKEQEQVTYMRHRPSEVDEKLKGHWVQKFVGGTPIGDKLTGQTASSRKGEVSVSVSSPGGKPNGRKPAGLFFKPKQTVEEEEKQKLIDELRQLQ